MTPKRKILFIIPTMRGGGAERVLIDVLNRFDFERYNVTLLLINKEGDLYNQIPSAVTKIALYDSSTPKLPIIENKYTQKIFLRLRCLIKLSPFKRFDTIISFLEGEALFLHTILFNRSKRDVSWVHTDMSINHWTTNIYPLLWQERKAYNMMNRIVLVSEQAKIGFEKTFGLNSKLQVLYNLIDRETIISKSIETCPIVKSSKHVICTAGRLSKEKRHDRLIKAITILRNEYQLDVELWIIGKGDNLPKLVDLANNLGIKDSISFLGFKTNPYPYIKSSDIFALSSDTEGYPLVICEALCLGKPIVSTDTTGPSELLADNVGILTEKDENSLAAGLAKLCQEPALLTEYSKRSIKKSMDFCPEEIMNEIYDIVN